MSGPAPPWPLACRREGLPAGHRECLLAAVPCPVLQPPPHPVWNASASSAAAILEPLPVTAVTLVTAAPANALASESSGSHVRSKESEGRKLPYFKWEEGAWVPRSEEEEGARLDHQAEDE